MTTSGHAERTSFEKQNSFESVEQVTDLFRQQGYIVDHRLATMVFLTTRLEKPVLIEGPAGVGKTELAKALSVTTGRKLIRLQCYEGLDSSQALYEWDYGKQLLYTQLLKDKTNNVLDDVRDPSDALPQLKAYESLFFSEHFLAERPIFQAIRSEQPSVLLIDEIDRADEQLEALLLEVLAELQVSVPELGTFSAVTTPYVIITSNNTRDLSPALKRRCLHLSLTYPSAERELEILRLKVPDIPEDLSRQIVDMIRALRSLDLRKAPSISEALDWAKALAVLNAESLDRKLVEETLMLLLKYDRDVEKAVEALPRIMGEEEHSHEHDHSHDHSHGHPYVHNEHKANYFGALRGGQR
ncbi:MAG TPA: MoxR family ATPase [Rubrobacteraceae bacterium]|nr:MoxR family ATPase [Rubrobacteraceae bacterium]